MIMDNQQTPTPPPFRPQADPQTAGTQPRQAAATMQATVAAMQQTIRDQHATLERFQDDLLFKTQRPLLMELIHLADAVGEVSAGPSSDETLLEEVRNLRRWIVSILADNSVATFTDEPGRTIDTRRQKVVGTEPTGQPELDGTYRTLRPGYEWTMPYLVASSEQRLQKIIEQSSAPAGFTFVIRPQELVRLCYQPADTE